MPDSTTVNIIFIQRWIKENTTLEKIKEELASSGFDEETISSHIREFKKLKYAKWQFTGFILLGIGAFLGFISCVLSIINPVPELYNLILYGLTSVAIAIILAGLYMVFQ